MLKYILLLIPVALSIGCRQPETGIESTHAAVAPATQNDPCPEPEDVGKEHMGQLPPDQERMLAQRLEKFCRTHVHLDTSLVWDFEATHCWFEDGGGRSCWTVPANEKFGIGGVELLVLLQDERIKASSFVPMNWVKNEEMGWPAGYRYLRPPRLRLEDLNHDGEDELVLRDRRHNGNSVNSAVEVIYGVRGTNLKVLGQFEYIYDDWSREAFLIREWHTEADSIAVYAADCPFPTRKRFVGSFKAAWQRDTVTFTDVKLVEELFAPTLVMSSLGSL